MYKSDYWEQKNIIFTGLRVYGIIVIKESKEIGKK